MYCSKCGQQLADNAKFCRFCGTAQDQTVQQAVNQAQQVQYAPVCANCGEPFEDNGSFCVKCGTRRTAVAQPAAAQYAQAQQYAAYAPVANANAASSGGSFLAWVPAIMTVLAIGITVYMYVFYYGMPAEHVLPNLIPTFIAALIVPILCAINGMMKKRSSAFCIVAAVFAGVSLLVQLVLNVAIVIYGSPYFFPGSIYLVRYVNGINTMRQLYEIVVHGAFHGIPIVLSNLLFVAKNIVALVASFIMAAKAKK